MTPLRAVRHAAAALLCSALLAPSAPTLAQPAADYPKAGPVRIIVPFSAGSTPDVMTRELAARLGEKLGQSFVVQNQPGASGITGTQQVARAEPDGYTLLSGTIGILAVNQFLYKDAPYDVERAFAPVSLFTRNPNVLVVPASAPYQSVAELIEAGKRQPDLLNYGSSGNGTSLHLAAEMLKSRTGMSATHIPYTKGVMTDLAAGRLDFVFYHISGAVPLADAGKARILAIATEQRLDTLPQVPTFKEAGLGDFDVSGWIGIMAPAGTPAPVIDRLSKAIQEVSQDPAWRAKLLSQGVELIGGTPEALNRHIDGERQKWGALIRDKKINVEQ